MILLTFTKQFINGFDYYLTILMAYGIESGQKDIKAKAKYIRQGYIYLKRELKYNELITKLKYRSIELKPIKELQLG